MRWLFVSSDGRGGPLLELVAVPVTPEQSVVLCLAASVVFAAHTICGVHALRRM